jgi:hypothetical protein
MESLEACRKNLRDSARQYMEARYGANAEGMRERPRRFPNLGGLATSTLLNLFVVRALSPD